MTGSPVSADKKIIRLDESVYWLNRQQTEMKTDIRWLVEKVRDLQDRLHRLEAQEIEGSPDEKRQAQATEEAKAHEGRVLMAETIKARINVLVMPDGYYSAMVGSIPPSWLGDVDIRGGQIHQVEVELPVPPERPVYKGKVVE